jgi:omega-amidase
MPTFTLIQSNLHWENKEANLNMFAQKIASIQQPTQVVVLPEMFSTGFSMQPTKLAETMDGPTVQWMQHQAAQQQATICGSIIVQEGNNYYNRFIWMPPNGAYQFYDKRHLFAFADEHLHYTAGTQKITTQLDDVTILPLVCYDLRFPVWSRQATNLYDALIYVANWPERRNAAWQALLVARAIENQCYVIAVNRVGQDGNNIYHSGNSMVINPMGEILFQQADDEIIHSITINKTDITDIRTKLPFLLDRDGFQITT